MASDISNLRVSTAEEIKKAFTSGSVVAVHEIGPYVIIEHHPPVFKNGSWTPRNGYHLDRSVFRSYVDGKDTCHQMESLDAALADAIAYRNEGRNSRAGAYFIRMLGKEGN